MKTTWISAVAVVACLASVAVAISSDEVPLLEALAVRMKSAGWTVVSKHATADGGVYRWEGGGGVVLVQVSITASATAASALLDATALRVTAGLEKVAGVGDAALAYDGGGGSMLLLTKNAVFVQVNGSSKDVARQFADAAVTTIGEQQP